MQQQLPQLQLIQFQLHLLLLLFQVRQWRLGGLIIRQMKFRLKFIVQLIILHLLKLALMLLLQQQPELELHIRKHKPVYYQTLHTIIELQLSQNLSHHISQEIKLQLLWWQLILLQHLLLLLLFQARQWQLGGLIIRQMKFRLKFIVQLIILHLLKLALMLLLQQQPELELHIRKHKQVYYQILHTILELQLLLKLSHHI